MDNGKKLEETLQEFADTLTNMVNNDVSWDDVYGKGE